MTSELDYYAGVFLSENTDDILFVAAGAAGSSQGYFTNFGKTQRQGFELGVSDRDSDGFDWSFDYSFVDATFESTACIVSEVNSTAGVGCNGTKQILVKPGNKIPGIPEHQIRLAFDYSPLSSLDLRATIFSYSDQYAHGNENNLHNVDGKVEGYQLLNLRGQYRFGASWSLIFKVNNVLDEKYSSGGMLAENAFNSSGGFITDEDDWGNETFYAPGAPRAAWLGIKYLVERD